MTPYEQAREVAERLGMDFDAMVKDHLQSGYVYSSPDGFICAMDASRSQLLPDKECIFVTLAVGNLDHFISIDPHRESRKWLGFCREDGGEVHWIPFSRLLKSDHI